MLPADEAPSGSLRLRRVRFAAKPTTPLPSLQKPAAAPPVPAPLLPSAEGWMLPWGSGSSHGEVTEGAPQKGEVVVHLMPTNHQGGRWVLHGGAQASRLPGDAKLCG